MHNTKTINIICYENLNLNRLKYTIDFLDNHSLKPENVSFLLNSKSESDVVIYYSNEKNSIFNIPVQNIFFSLKKTKQSNFFTNKYSFKTDFIYSIETKSNDLESFFYKRKYAFDIFETIFFHISRYEEVHCSSDDLDIHQRMKMENQLLFKSGLHYSPIVDNLVFAFLKSLDINIAPQKTTYSITHDIDIIRKYNSYFKSLKSLGKVLQMGLGLKGVKHIFKSLLKSQNNKTADPYYTYDWLFSSNSKFKNKTVYFVAGGKTRYDLYNNSYLKELPTIISKALDNSYSIGFHPSYNAFVNDNLFKEEYKRLNDLTDNNIDIVRMHYLRLDIQQTFEIFESIGLNTDSTLGYANDIGFRCGTGFKYYPYNFKEERAWKFKEIPLVLMDSALLFGQCNDDIKCFNEKMQSFIKQNETNTHITFNFHNATFDNSLKSRLGLKKIYLDLVKSIS